MVNTREGGGVADQVRSFLRTASARAPMSQTLLAVGVTIAVIVVAVDHRAAVDAGGQSLASADGSWLIVAMAATAAIWVVGTVTQIGSMPVLPPVHRVFAVQFAAAFANHLLPAGAGGIAVNVRFLRRLGLSRSAAVGAVALNSLAGLVTHLLLLAAAIVLAPGTLSGMRDQLRWPDRRSITEAVPYAMEISAAVLGALAVLTAVLAVRGVLGVWAGRAAVRLRAVRARMVKELAALGAVVRHPVRAAALWLGSLTVPLLHGVILFALLRSLEVAIGALTVAVIYVVVSSVVALVPSPGGIGGLDVVLVAVFVTAGVPSAPALGAVLGYRLLTVWVPLVPGACVLAFLLRRRII